MGTINIYDCGCVVSRPRTATCNTYGTRWRVYTTMGMSSTLLKIVLKCRDCGRVRHFVLAGTNNPVMIQYGQVEEE